MEDIIRKYNEFVVVDIETSHFHPDKGAMIIEIGAVKIRGDKVVGEFSTLIDPQRKITAKITEITGISNDMLQGQPYYQQILPEFYDFCKGSVIIAHNAMFDWDRFLIHFFKKIGIYPKNPVVDTLKLTKKYLPKNKGGYKLGAICDALGIKNEDSHRALSDAKATAEVFLYIKQNLIPEMPGDQMSLMDQGTFKDEQEVERQNVRKVAYWEKEIKKNKVMKRAYITLDKAVVYFDIPTESWGVKSSNGPIDFSQVEKDVMKHLKINDIKKIGDYFN